MFWVLSCGMLGLEGWEEMGWTQMGEPMDWIHGWPWSRFTWPGRSVGGRTHRGFDLILDYDEPNEASIRGLASLLLRRTESGFPGVAIFLTSTTSSWSPHVRIATYAP